MAVLVAYASAQGSTREIAQHVAERMSAALGEVECRSVEQIDSVSGYGAVVVGSAIHNQAWLSPAVEFLAQHGPELAERPVWAFSVGMSDGLPKLFRGRGAELQKQRLEQTQFHDVPLRGHAVFSGVYEASQLSAPLGALFRLTGGRFGDLRDWAAIDAWADQIAAELAKPAPPQS
ncbi:flavodoxin domain-containing protein [Arthrobacter sp. NPDC058097]|uniref:flavodoxin domain-containing protein n=1 Tax=Arthrobacter sp. NPDC058097 TaxID=3346340 RepID=UPI0036DD51EC